MSKETKYYSEETIKKIILGIVAPTEPESEAEGNVTINRPPDLVLPSPEVSAEELKERRMEIINAHCKKEESKEGVNVFFAYHNAMKEYAKIVLALHVAQPGEHVLRQMDAVKEPPTEHKEYFIACEGPTKEKMIMASALFTPNGWATTMSVVWWYKVISLSPPPVRHMSEATVEHLKKWSTDFFNEHNRAPVPMEVFIWLQSQSSNSVREQIEWPNDGEISKEQRRTNPYKTDEHTSAYFKGFINAISYIKSRSFIQSQPGQNEDAGEITTDDVIAKIKIDPANLEHIAKTGKINGTLLYEIKRAIYSYSAKKIALLNSGQNKNEAVDVIDAFTRWAMENGWVRNPFTNKQTGVVMWTKYDGNLTYHKTLEQVISLFQQEGKGGGND